VPVEVGVVHVDKVGYRVVGGLGVRDEAGLARAAVSLARAMLEASRALGKPAGSVKVDWGDATMVVGVRNGEVVAIVVAEQAEQVPAAASGRAGVVA